MQSALLTPRINPGSLYRCGKSTLSAACALRQEGKGPEFRPKTSHRPTGEELGHAELEHDRGIRVYVRKRPIFPHETKKQREFDVITCRPVQPPNSAALNS